MPNRTADTYDTHMWIYRDHLRNLNRALAEEYLRQHSHLWSTAIEELIKAVPVAVAIAQLHEAIRQSPAKNFWPIIRKTKGVLLVRPTDTGEECPRPWKRTRGGNMRYELPGHLLFSPWPPNFQRRLRNGIPHFQRVMRRIEALENENDFWAAMLAGVICNATRGTKRNISMIKAIQGFAMPDSIAALDRWSDDQQGSSNISLRISQGTLVYNDGSNRCEIEVPDALSDPLCVPSVPDPLELLWVRAGERSYYP